MTGPGPHPRIFFGLFNVGIYGTAAIFAHPSHLSAFPFIPWWAFAAVFALSLLILTAHVIAWIYPETVA